MLNASSYDHFNNVLSHKSIDVYWDVTLKGKLQWNVCVHE